MLYTKGPPLPPQKVPLDSTSYPLKLSFDLLEIMDDLRILALPLLR
jgi:hypothetical protein